ncbi:TPA: hypothetical protein ACGVRU_001447 [Enterococcus faecium]
MSTSEKMIVSHLFNNEKISVKEASEVLKKGVGYSRKVLKEMLRKKIIQWHGTSTKDPTQYYSLNRVKQSKIE